jgi:hypothetical protein
MDEFSFDRLVARLSAEERDDLLKKVRVPYDEAANSLSVKAKDIPALKGNLAEQYGREGLFFRIILTIRAFFQGTPKFNIYREALLRRIARQIDKKYSGLMDYPKKVLLQPLFDRVVLLKGAADYFYASFTSVEEDEGKFYVFVGAFFLPKISEGFQKDVDPHNHPFATDDVVLLRINLLKKLDRLLQTIESEERTRLYGAIQSLHWLLQFTSLPFRGLIAQFAGAGKGSTQCTFASAAPYLDQFAKILCNGRPLQRELFNALYLYDHQDSVDAALDVDAAGVLETGALTFTQTASAHIQVIKDFMRSVPLEGLGVILHRSVAWAPEQPDTAEDWFVKYKASWRNIFDRAWDAWLEERSRELTRKKLDAHFHIDHFPLLPHRPWAELFEGLPFKYDVALGFLLHYYRRTFPHQVRQVEQVLLDGRFPQQLIRDKTSDALEALVTRGRSLDTLLQRLTPEGDLGSQFLTLAPGAALNQRKIITLLSEVAAEALSIIKAFMEAVPALTEMLDRIMGIITADRRNAAEDGPTGPQDAMVGRLSSLKADLLMAGNLIAEARNVTVGPGDRSETYGDPS